MDDSATEISSETPYVDQGDRRFTLREAALVVAIVVVAAVLFAGDSMHRTAEQMDAGVERTVVVAATEPAGWIARRLPLADAADDATAWLSPDDESSTGEGFTPAATATGGGAPPPVTPEAFDPAALGEEVERRPLERLLVTGDSLAMPLDAELARALSEDDVETIRDPHLGTGISKSGVVDWNKLARRQTAEHEADAVVVFIGANEGFPLPSGTGADIECCGPAWAAAYATRARTMMDVYRRGGAARVYWLTLPAPRDEERAEIARSVNAAVRVAAEPFRAHVRIVDMNALFTPGDRFRAAMSVDGEETVVRESDGIHLNPDGSRVAADEVLVALDRDFVR